MVVNPSSTCGRAMMHATYGKSSLFLGGLMAAGYRRENILALCTQVEELPVLRRYLPDAQIIRPAIAPNRHETPWEGMAQAPELNKIARISGLEFSDLILADRHLRRHPADRATQWLNATVELFTDLLDDWRPSIIVGETANASEILLASLAEVRSIPFVQPATLRIPSQRFGLWLGTRSEELWTRPNPSNSGAPSEYLHQWLEEAERPFYFASNSQAPTGGARKSAHSLQRTVRRLGSRGGFDMQRPLASDYYYLPWLNRLRKVRYAKAASRISWDAVPESSFVFFPLHVQPEASVDWYSADWRAQLRAVRTMSHLLQKEGLELVVKDHANFLWSRGSRFHERLRSDAHAHAVDPSVSSADLMSKAVCTLTVSGTVALEAGLRGLPALMVSDHPWSELPTVKRIDRPDRIVEGVKLVRHTAPSPPDVRLWFTRFWESSWPGLIADSYSRPEVTGTKNVELLGEALAEFSAHHGA
jgi:hypothetical protein